MITINDTADRKRIRSLVRQLEIKDKALFSEHTKARVFSAKNSLYQTCGRRYKIKKVEDKIDLYTIERIPDVLNFTKRDPKEKRISQKRQNIKYLAEALILLQRAQKEVTDSGLKLNIQNFINSIK